MCPSDILSDPSDINVSLCSSPTRREIPTVGNPLPRLTPVVSDILGYKPLPDSAPSHPPKPPPSSLPIIGPFSFHFFPQNFLNPLNHLQALISGSIPLACYPWWMSTTKQIDANRRNALNSGRPLGRPRSAERKAASSANSLKTSLYARSQVIAGEDPAELRALAGQYFLRWQPATPEESFLVATLIDAEWLLRRHSLADAKIWDYKGADDCVRDDPNGKGLNLSAAACTSPSSSAAPIPPCAPSTAPCTISNASSPNAAPKPRPQTQNPLPCYPRKPKPISPNSNRLNKKLGSFLHFSLLRNPPATAPIPCRWSLPVTGSRLTRRPSRPRPSVSASFRGAYTRPGCRQAPLPYPDNPCPQAARCAC